MTGSADDGFSPVGHRVMCMCSYATFHLVSEPRFNNPDRNRWRKEETAPLSEDPAAVHFFSLISITIKLKYCPGDLLDFIHAT